MTALEAALAGESFAAIFNLGNLLIFLFLSLGNTALLTLVAGKFLLALQQCGYKGKRYLKWVRGKHNGYFSRLMLLSLMSILFFCVTCMCFSTIGGEWVRPSAYIGLLAYLLFILVYLDAERHVTAKLPLKMTRRLVRLIVTYVLLQLILNFGLIVLTNYIVFATKSELYFILRYFPICFLPLLAPFVLWLAYIINEPMERANNRRYIRDCKRVLDQSDIVKIGITGSFGKTSVKNILTGILSQKYRVLSTPGSYNTPLGISLTVKKLDATHDIFIAEMGARHVGDISDLAAIVKPQYAVLTGVNTQHLESFGSEEKILETKFELFEGLSPAGVGFFSADNAGSLELYRRFGGTKFLAGISEGDDLVFADEIDISEHGTAFTLRIRGEKPVHCLATLLGKHNISNICLAAAVAYRLGMSPTEIALGINKLSAIEHRLALLPNHREIVIIDDSYNANEDGIAVALEVLSTFPGRKIVVTPGLIELGARENEANYAFGKQLAEKADKVIVVGRHNAEMLIKGMLDAGMQREDILFERNLSRGNERLNEIGEKGDVVLFENDLPDTYS